jgi:hypothetical protein
MVAVKTPMLPDFLWHGAEAYGLRGEVWTCGRVAQVIEEKSPGTPKQSVIPSRASRRTM